MRPPFLIELVNVSKSYPDPSGNRECAALERICFRMTPGCSTGVTGPSGAGKSTLARLILGMERPTSGDLLFFGRRRSRCKKAGRKWFSRNIQMVWQDPMVYLNPYRTAFQTLAEALTLRGVRGLEQKDRILSLLRMVRLSSTILSRRPHEMSGGQAQRLSLARALAMEPKLLICDEIFSGLDLPNQAGLIALLADLQKTSQTTLLLISHDPVSIQKLCGHLVVLAGGRIVSEGAPKRLFPFPDHGVTQALIRPGHRSPVI